MTLVVDASVAFKWFVPVEPLFSQAIAVWQDEPVLIAPDLVIVEVCNAAWRAVRIEAIGSEQAFQISEEVSGFFHSLVGATSLCGRAMTIARQLDHPVYDCMYLSLAEAHGCRFVTADKTLLRKIRAGVWNTVVLDLADYGSTG